MHELAHLCRAANAARAAGDEVFLATVVRVRGSAYRHAGARLLFSPGAVLAGSVSGGCLEADIVRSGAWAVREGPVLRSYEAQNEADAEVKGSGCGGQVDVLLEADPRGTGDVIGFIAGRLAAERRGVIVTVFESRTAQVPLAARVLLAPGAEPQVSGITNDELERELVDAARTALAEGGTRAHTMRDGALSALIEVIEPAPHLFVFGSGRDVVPLAELARAVGWSVSVCAPSARVSVRERFHGLARLVTGSARATVRTLQSCERALAVVMAHDYEADREALAALLDCPPRYIGVLGPAARTRRMLAELGFSPNASQSGALARVHAPCGLHLGGETPAEIALSIIAEGQAVLRAATAAPLRERRGSHELQRSRPALRLASSGGS